MISITTNLTVATLVRVHEPGIQAYALSDSTARSAERLHAGKREDAKAGGKDRQRVLVVDDENLIADSVAEILNRNGYDAIARYSCKAAIQAVEERCPDIIVTDVIMPDSSGIQLAKAVRAHCPGTRILLFSGNAATSNLLHHASKDGYSFELLAKPVHPVELLKALRS